MRCCLSQSLPQLPTKSKFCLLLVLQATLDNPLDQEELVQADEDTWLGLAVYWYQTAGWPLHHQYRALWDRWAQHGRQSRA